MKANEARKLANAYAIGGMDKIYAAIKSAATKGDTSVSLGRTFFEVRDTDRVKAQLVGDGYTVKREQGYDQREQDSWDYLIVSW
jgi:hypothetical protein